MFNVVPVMLTIEVYEKIQELSLKIPKCEKLLVWQAINFSWYIFFSH